MHKDISNAYRRYMPYTPEEDQMLREGATKLPGRTPQSVYQRRSDLGLVTAKKWTPEEIEMARNNIVPPGRTRTALQCMRSKLGITRTIGMSPTGQMELKLYQSIHSTKHISEIVGQFARTVDILLKSGMTVKEIADQTGKDVTVVQLAIDLASALRLKK